MICFDVYLNGQKMCRAGKQELSVLSGTISYVRASEHYPTDELKLAVGGLYHDSSAKIHPTWAKDMELKPGDEVAIRIVEADLADEPTHEVAYTTEDDRRQERAYFEMLRVKYETEAD